MNKIELAAERGSFFWELPRHKLDRRDSIGNIQGVLLMDVDGTMTRPGSMYAIDSEVIDVLAEYTQRGGYTIFNTGANLGRLERNTLSQLFNRIDESTSTERARELFQQGVVVMPENGSAINLNRGVQIIENELYFLWHVLHPLHVPDKPALRKVIEEEMLPRFEHSYVVGDAPGDLNPRQYILCWQGIRNTLDQVEMIQKEIIPHHPEIHWSDIGMKAARTTIDFVHANSGKRITTGWILRELGFLQGQIIGFGDLGDEFGSVVPTINVNQLKPNEFRRRGIPSMELTRWKLMENKDYVVTGQGKQTKVRNKSTDEEVNVLRDEEGQIIFSGYKKKSGQRYIVPIQEEGKGYPVKIKPITYKDGETIKEIQDAGKGTAWMLRRLMDVGYFSSDR